MKINTLLEKRPTLSFEIFPPKNKDGNIDSIYATIDELSHANPDFISVTYGAGGSTTKNTLKISSLIKNQYHIESVAHLSCIDASEESMREILTKLKEENIENILALRGDFPENYNHETQASFSYASDLTAFIEKEFPNTFCVSGACYPEVHGEAESLNKDLLNLKKKVDAGAKYLVTQIFYDNNYYYRLVREARKIGIDVPILAGIMPAINSKRMKSISKLSGCSIPYEFSTMIERFSDDDEAMCEVGMNYATYQIMDLISNGADGIHIYTMNKPAFAKEILKRITAIRKEFTNVSD